MQNPHLRDIYNYFFFWPCCKACRIVVPQPGMSPAPCSASTGVLTIGLPGKSYTTTFYLTVFSPDFSVAIRLGFPCGSAGKESACNEGDLIEVESYPLQYSGLENSMGVAKSWTRLSNFHFHFHFRLLMKTWFSFFPPNWLNIINNIHTIGNQPEKYLVNLNIYQKNQITKILPCKRKGTKYG